MMAENKELLFALLAMLLIGKYHKRN